MHRYSRNMSCKQLLDNVKGHPAVIFGLFHVVLTFFFKNGPLQYHFINFPLLDEKNKTTKKTICASILDVQ